MKKTIEQQRNEKPYFSTFEWVLLIIILCCIGYICQIHHKSINAQSYISFTGTIVSIIVGILAIVYAMLESVRQSNSNQKMQAGADAIDSAANKLVDTLKSLESIKDSTELIQEKLEHTSNAGLNQLSEALESLNEKLEKLDDIKRQVQVMDESINTMFAGNSKSKPSQNKSEPKLTIEQTKIVIRHLAFGVISNPIPFALITLATKRGQMFLRYAKTDEYKDLVGDLDTDFFFTRDAVIFGMGIMHNMLCELLVIRSNKKNEGEPVAYLDKNYESFMVELCFELKSNNSLFPASDSELLTKVLAAIWVHLEPFYHPEEQNIEKDDDL